MAEVPQRQHDPKRRGAYPQSDIAFARENGYSLKDMYDNMGPYSCPSCGRTTFEEVNNPQINTMNPGQKTDESGRSDEFPDACPCCGDCRESHPENSNGNKVCPVVD
jgi:hypothetical protein